jgi:hypothetical protein
MSDFSTIHIFGTANAQIIGAGLNKQVPQSSLTTLVDVVADVKSKRPSDVEGKDHHVIHIFGFGKVNHLAGKKEGNFRFDLADLDQVKLSALVAELLAYQA